MTGGAKRHTRGGRDHRRPSRSNAARASQSQDKSTLLIRARLDTLEFGFAIFDPELRLVTSNKPFCTLRGYPAALCKPGTELVDFHRFNASAMTTAPATWSCMQCRA